MGQETTGGHVDRRATDSVTERIDGTAARGGTRERHLHEIFLFGRYWHPRNILDNYIISEGFARIIGRKIIGRQSRRSTDGKNGGGRYACHHDSAHFAHVSPCGDLLGRQDISPD
ncbi:hypothetical protein GCM10022403_023390 [Streptomyces coacervatus]|uniref:Uncharacterized protein n=1 Tax=Streptomyces coacervatus TaxID=647381 RepID=A0ABP7HDZ1_9ACTN